MTPLFARAPLRLHPISRLRIVRMLACVLALALLASGPADAAQPLVATGAAAGSQSLHSASTKAAPCTHDAATSADHPDRHAGDCCSTKLCICAPSGIVWAPAAAAPPAFARTGSALPVAPPRSVHAIATLPPLRPPIG